MKLPVYAKYKPSGVEWLGDVPEHWTTWKATHAFKRIGSGTTPRSDDASYYDGDVPWVTTSELRETVIQDTAAKVTTAAVRDFSALHTYPAGTLLFAMYGATIGRLGILGIPATVNQACAAFAGPVQLDTMFVYYWLQMRRPTLIVLSAGGGQPNLSQEDLRRLRIPAPPLSEQSAIAGFLDRETAKVDALVAKKRTLVERLKEKRMALISRTVTRGLPPDAARAAGLTPYPKLKPSGIDWLGDVPAHWSLTRLKYILAAPLKYGANEAAELDAPELPRYVRITDIDEADGLREETFRSLPADVASEYLLREGDLLFARSGATAGKSFRYRSSWGTCAYAGYLIRARPDGKRVLPDFVRYFTASVNYWQWISSSLIQATIQNVSAEKYASLWLPLPGIGEQRGIAAFLDRETAKIDRMSAAVESAIERLQEYRTALITAAVTGKIDVRQLAAKETSS